MSHIDGIDFGRALGEQHIGEPARRCADIEGHHAGYINREMIERMRQLDATTRYPRMVLGFDLDLLIVGKRRARLVELAVAAPYLAGKNQRLRLGARFRQAAFDKNNVESLFCRQSDVRRAPSRDQR